MSRPLVRYKSWLLPLAKLAIVVLVVWGVRRTLVTAFEELGQYEFEFSLGWLLLAAVLYLVGLAPTCFFWRRVLAELGQDAPPWATLRAYYIGHLGKYVPGKAMVVVLRTGLLRGRVDAVLAAVTAIYETITMMAVGALTSAVLLAIWYPDQTWLIALSVGLFVVMGIPAVPPVFRRLIGWASFGRLSTEAGERLAGLPLGTLAVGWGLIAGGWLLMGLSLWAVLRAMGVADLDAVGQLPLYTAAVALAVVAGFLSLIPGGTIVREAVLMQLMVPQFGQVVALVSALLLRVVWLVAELGISGILYMGVPRSQREAAPASSPDA